MRPERLLAAAAALAIAALAISLAAAPSRASDEPGFNGTQLHIRAGLVGASFSGPDLHITSGNGTDPSSNNNGTGGTSAVKLMGSFSVINSLEVDYEIFNTGRSSFVLRGTIAHDLSENRLKYAYMGVAKRYYLSSSGMAYDVQGPNGSVSSIPTWRFYVEGGLGISQVTVAVTTAVYQIQSALFEFGANLGVIHQVGRSFGVELVGGYGMGLGFSSVSVGATTQRVLLGVSYYY